MPGIVVFLRSQVQGEGEGGAEGRDASSRGQAKSIANLAEQERVTTADLRAATAHYLAPDIVVAIVDGRQPTDLRLAELLGSGPLDWNEQRANWGFSK